MREDPGQLPLHPRSFPVRTNLASLDHVEVLHGQLEVLGRVVVLLGDKDSLYKARTR